MTWLKGNYKWVVLVALLVLILGMNVLPWLVVSSVDEDVTITDVEVQAIPKTRITWAIIKKMTVENDAAIWGTASVDTIAEYTSGGGVTIDGLTIKDGGTSSTGVTNFDDTDNALNGTQTLTPTASFYEFAPTAVLTLTLATGSASVGDLLILQNTVSTNTVVVDTGATVGGGNITLSTNDLAIFIFTNTKWVEIASPDNS